MNCLDVSASIPLFLDEELPVLEMDLVRGHLSGCVDCNHKLQLESLFKSTLKEKLSRRLATAAILDDVRNHIRNQI